MDKDINELYQVSMSLLMETEAKTYKCFFTQKEFEKNMGKIFTITSAKRNLQAKIDKLNSIQKV